MRAAAAFLAATFVAAMALAISACARQSIDVQVEARGRQSFTLVYSGLYGAEKVDLGPADASRARDWSVETAGVAFKTEAGRDALAPTAGAAALPPSVSIRVESRPLSVAAQTATRLGSDSGVIATRMIMPYTDEKPAGRLSFVAGKSALAAAFGASAPSVSDWRGRSGAGGLVFIGPGSAKPGAGASIVFDRATPPWIEAEAGSLLAKLPPAFEKATGRKLQGALDVFIGVAESPSSPIADSLGNPLADEKTETGFSDSAPPETGLRYAATQTPSQIVIELKGAGWRDASPDAAELLWRALSSESAKQWLASLKSPPPPWIAEGAADALADEAMLTAKIWTADDAARALAKSHAACAALIADRPLAEAAKDPAAARPCGHAFAKAAAGAKGAAAFWRDFDKAAKASGKSGVDQFLLTAAKHADAHDAALMRTLMKASGREAADALEALRRDGLQ